VSRRGWLCSAIVVAVASLLPVVTGREDVLNLGFLLLLYVALGQSWNILGGFTGQVNLGHAAFFGIGALGTRQLWLAGQWPFALALLVGGLAAAAFALLVGVPTLRLRGAYFSIATLALAEALRIVVANQLPNINALPAQATADYSIAWQYELALGVASLAMLVAFIGHTSRVGLGWAAVRGDEEAARATGVDPLRHKLAALLISGLLAGLAGGTFALHQASFYAQFLFEPSWTFDALLITFIGGVGTIIGPLVGAAFYILAREQLALALAQFHQVVFGLLFIVVVLVLPGGLMDAWQQLRSQLDRSAVRARRASGWQPGAADRR
jgi:branched-chain amino acid transport system permease protein